MDNTKESYRHLADEASCHALEFLERHLGFPAGQAVARAPSRGTELAGAIDTHG